MARGAKIVVLRFILSADSIRQKIAICSYAVERDMTQGDIAQHIC